jgi:TetR/AcrR family transcriptional regulator, transcriptional repressor for nem operon
MGSSQTEKAASHDRIVDEAARQIRARGTDQPGVAEIMRAAGMTHGGFYKHFSSREQLISEAAERAMAAAEPVVAASLAQSDPLAAFADWYMSTAHRDDPANGCGVAALANDAPHAQGVQAAYRDQVERYLDVLQEMLSGDREEELASRHLAAVNLATLVGGVVIARALGDTPTSRTLLADVREAVRERRLLAGS